MAGLGSGRLELEKETSDSDPERVSVLRSNQLPSRRGRSRSKNSRKGRTAKEKKDKKDKKEKKDDDVKKRNVADKMAARREGAKKRAADGEIRTCRGMGCKYRADEVGSNLSYCRKCKRMTDRMASMAKSEGPESVKMLSDVRADPKKLKSSLKRFQELCPIEDWESRKFLVVGSACRRNQVLTLRVSPPAHAGTTPRRVEVIWKCGSKEGDL